MLKRYKLSFLFAFLLILSLLYGLTGCKPSLEGALEESCGNLSGMKVGYVDPDLLIKQLPCPTTTVKKLQKDELPACTRIFDGSFDIEVADRGKISGEGNLYIRILAKEATLLSHIHSKICFDCNKPSTCPEKYIDRVAKISSLVSGGAGVKISLSPKDLELDALKKILGDAKVTAGGSGSWFTWESNVWINGVKEHGGELSCQPAG